jgi:hypothetical protein
MEKVRVRLILLAEMLGTAAADPNIHEKFIASNAPDAPTREEEIAAIGTREFVEKSMTVFPRDENGQPIVWAYQIKGFFKSACSALRTIKGTESSKIKAYKKEIDLRWFVYPHAEDKTGRAIPINLAGEIGSCQRPLRAQTMQGERVSLANSETVPKGSTIEFDVVTIGEMNKALLLEWLEYGQFNGLLQWRNSGRGAFGFVAVDENGEIVGGNMRSGDAE